MRNGSGQDRPDDDERWNVTLDDDFVNGATIREEQMHRSSGDRLPKRVWPRNLALALGAATLTFLVFKVVQPAPDKTSDRPGGLHRVVSRHLHRFRHFVDRSGPPPDPA
jgi:hypothetical protein